MYGNLPNVDVNGPTFEITHYTNSLTASHAEISSSVLDESQASEMR
jgi:hypothetical protein